MPIEIKVVRTAAGIRNAHTRMPFRFGVITMTAAPLLTLAVEIEAGGGRATGHAADFLAFRWFDKRPERSLADNCADLLRTVEVARALYLEAGRDGFAAPFELWRATHGEIERIALEEGFNRLGAAFGSSMLERAVIDAVGRLSGRTLFELVQDDLLGIELGAISKELHGRRMREFLPERPLERVAVRHTVGLVDPITAADVSDPVADGLPETLEDYLDRDGIRYLKIKVAGALEQDIARLERVAAVLDRRERRCHVSLDGNEQYRAPDDFLGLIEGIKAAPKLRRLYDQIMFIEQPLDRAVTLDVGAQPMLRALDKPVIIDEADGFVGAFREAVRLGYRGISHKNCKGVYKSLHNLARAAVHNARRRPTRAVPLGRGSLEPAGRAAAGRSRDGGAARHRPRRAQRPSLFPRPRAPAGGGEGGRARGAPRPLPAPGRRGVPQDRGRHAGLRLAPGPRHGLCGAARPGGDDAGRRMGLREPRPGGVSSKFNLLLHVAFVLATLGI